MANLLKKGHKDIYNSWLVCLNAFQTLFMPCGCFTALHSKAYFFCKYLQFHWRQFLFKLPTFFRCPQTEFAEMMQVIYCSKSKLPWLLSIMNLIGHTYYTIGIGWFCHSLLLERLVLHKSLEDFLPHTQIFRKQIKPYCICTQSWKTCTCIPSASHMLAFSR